MFSSQPPHVTRLAVQQLRHSAAMGVKGASKLLKKDLIKFKSLKEVPNLENYQHILVDVNASYFSLIRSVHTERDGSITSGWQGILKGIPASVLPRCTFVFDGSPTKEKQSVHAERHQARVKALNSMAAQIKKCNEKARCSKSKNDQFVVVALKD